MPEERLQNIVCNESHEERGRRDGPQKTETTEMDSCWVLEGVEHYKLNKEKENINILLYLFIYLF